MDKDIKTYFEQTIIPLITKKHPKVTSEMAIMIQGSYGLGIADESSDLDAVIYLEDTLWKTYGGEVQLLLEHSSHSFAKTIGHPEICVHPFSWLLKGQHKDFLQNKPDLPWEKVMIEDLFELQENLVLRDPHNIFHRLRDATAPKQFPAWLWKKLLILKLKKLFYEDLDDLILVSKRNRMFEFQIILGSVLEGLLHLGFIINKQYYPWRTHLHWAFEKLPELVNKVLPDMEVMTSSTDRNKKVASIKAISVIYKEYIARNRILPEINILTPKLTEELIWAERGKAWSNPNWCNRNRITRCQQKAKEAGYDSSDGWIWSLWGWS